MTPSFTELAQHALNRISPPPERIAIRSLLCSAELPEAVKGFLRMEIEIALRSDSGEDIGESTIQAVLNRLVDIGSLGRTDATRVVESAYKDASGYLTQPEAYLLELLSQQDDPVPIDDYFFHALGYIREYIYFPELLELWARRQKSNGITEVTSIELQEQIRMIDRSVAGVLTGDQIGLLLSPLYELFENQKIEKELLVRFFQDKSAFAVVLALQSDLRYQFSKPELLDLISIEMHRLANGAQQLTTSDVQPYVNFLDELKQAGIVIGAPNEAAFLKEIQGRE